MSDSSSEVNLSLAERSPLQSLSSGGNSSGGNSSGDTSSVGYHDINNDDSDSDTSDDVDSLRRFQMPKGSQKKEAEAMVNTILHKPKPRYAWTALPALYYRQNGLNGNGRQRMTSNWGPNSFEHRMYGSLHAVERLELMYKLERHTGCVNSLNFNKSGNLLVTGSDDLSIIIWKWASNEILHTHESGHFSNIFQTKFLEIDNIGIDVVSSSRDGQIRHSKILPSGGKPITKVIATHSSAVNKMAVTPNNPCEILSAGEDGRIVRCDLRENIVERLLTVRTEKKGRVGLYSIANHPIDPEFCVCGRDSYVRVFDRRNVKTPTKLFCPNAYLNVSLQIHTTKRICFYLKKKKNYFKRDQRLIQIRLM